MSLAKLFLTIFISVCSFSVLAQEHSTEAKDEEERWVPVSDTLTIDELLDVAVRFFAILKIDEDDHYMAQLCTATAAHAYTEENRDKKLEAFCTGVIFSHLNDKYGLNNEFINGVKEVGKMHLGLNKDERLLRAQGALFMLMKMNPKLREVFRMEYQEQKHMLHFYLLPEG